VITIGGKLIPKGDDQSNPEEPTRSNKHILLKDIQIG
jgi:hypothetical protein